MHGARGKKRRHRPQQLPQELSALPRLSLDTVSRFVARALGGNLAGAVGELVDDPITTDGAVTIGSRGEGREGGIEREEAEPNR